MISEVDDKYSELILIIYNILFVGLLVKVTMLMYLIFSSTMQLETLNKMNRE